MGSKTSEAEKVALIKFTRNYDELSNDNGFQFKFYCDRCGNGYESLFEASATGIASQALDAAANIFGGFLGGAANVGHLVQSAAWGKAHDAALQHAIDEVKPYFRQCKRCGKWVDDTCWNKERGLCLDDAPDLESEYSVAQTQAVIEDAREKARTVDYVSPEKFKQTVVGTCPHCGARLSGGKFCP